MVVGTDATVSLDVADGTHTYTLTVSDGELESSNEVTVKIVDTTPPSITASFQLVDDDDDLYRVVFECSDSCDSNPFANARVNGIAVENGQHLELEIDDDSETEWDNGILSIEAPSITLSVECEDASGNTSMENVSFVPSDDDDDDDDYDDDEDDDD